MSNDKKVTSQNEEITEDNVEDTLSEQIKDVIDQEPDNRTQEQKDEDNKSADFLSIIRDKVWKFFDEEIMTSDIPVELIEAHLVQYVQGAVSITRGQSKLWEEMNKIQEKYYKTPMNKLELYKDVEETKEQD